MNAEVMNGRLNPGVEPSVDRSVLEGDHEDHLLELSSLAALGHISNGPCGSPDVTRFVKCEEPSVSWYQGPNPGWKVLVEPCWPVRPLLPIPLGATLPRVLVTGGGGVGGGPQGVEEDIHSVKDPSVTISPTLNLGFLTLISFSYFNFVNVSDGFVFVDV